ncbi:MAG: hypothetical protein KF802_10095 [Bdellovibrionaceae bacterium]|nr:hypothetical protein [Pseudobdellovibrionaceae bacterium]MBX3033762.1 hypothetical protein [Pseudobdellovibrionaceae bacterium]
MRKILRQTMAVMFALQSTAGASSWQDISAPPGVQPAPAASPTPSPAPATAPATAPGPAAQPNVSTPSQNQASQGSQGQNNSSSQIAQQVGQGLLSAGTSMMSSCAASQCSCCPAAAALIGMGLMGLAQSGANKGAGGQNGYVAGISAAGYDPYGGNYDTSGSLDNIEPFKPSSDAVKNLSNILAKDGVKFDGKKITLPDGKSINVSDMGNRESMAAAGISPSDINKAMNLAAELEKKAAAEVEKVGSHTASSGFSEGGGGSGRSVASTDTSGGGGSGLSAADPKPTVAGMTRNYNGENIGVAGDSIFAMMARRYEIKKKEAVFLPPDSTPN